MPTLKRKPTRKTAGIRRDLAAMVRRLLAGQTSMEAEARRYGVNAFTVRALYRSRTTAAQRADGNRRRWDVGGAMARLEADGEAVLRELLEGTLTVRDAATQYGMSPQRLARWYAGRATPAQIQRAARRKCGGFESFPVGTVRRRKYGGTVTNLVKVRSDGAQYGRWRPVAVLVWEAAHGPVPPGHRVIHLRGTEDDSIGNLACLTDAAALRLRMADPANAARMNAGRAKAARERVRPRALEQRRREVDRERGRDRVLATAHACPACEYQTDPGQPPPARCPRCLGLTWKPVRVDLPPAGKQAAPRMSAEAARAARRLMLARRIDEQLDLVA